MKDNGYEKAIISVSLAKPKMKPENRPPTKEELMLRWMLVKNCHSVCFYQDR